MLTSDVSGFGGCKPGRYSTGEISVDVLPDGRIVVAGQTQFLAGSGATTGECVAHFMKAGSISLRDAWLLASTSPARLMKIPTTSLQEGELAHLTVFRMLESRDADGNATWTYQPEAAFAGEMQSH